MNPRRMGLLLFAAVLVCGALVQAGQVVIHLLPGPGGTIDISPNPAIVEPGDQVSWFASASLEGNSIPFGASTVAIDFHPRGTKEDANGSPFEPARRPKTYTFPFPGGGPGEKGLRVRDLPGRYAYSIRFLNAGGEVLKEIDPALIIPPPINDELPHLSFAQIDFILDGVETLNSSWGSVTLTSKAVGCVLYFNLAINGVWRIRNIPIPCLRHAGEPQKLTLFFDLGVPVGVNVTNLNYAYLLTTDVLDAIPSDHLAASVDDRTVVMCGGVAGQTVTYSPPASVLEGATVVDSATLFALPSFPNQECLCSECVPAAVSNSLTWLNSKYNLNLAPWQVSIAEMKKATGWQLGGAPADWPPLKDAYMRANGYPITTRKITSFDEAIAQLRAGQDVEIDSKIHSAALVSISKLADGRYALVVAHDTMQGQSGGAIQQPITYDPKKPKGQRFTGGKWFEGYEFDFFTVECPVLVVRFWGEWLVDIMFDLLQPSFADSISFTSTCSVSYGVGDWVFTSETTLDDTEWIDQRFSATGILGAFTITSLLDLDPDLPLFESWTTIAAISIAGIDFVTEFVLEDSDVKLGLSVAGVAGDVSLGVDVTFGGIDPGDDVCDLPFSDVTIDVGCPFCCADISASIFFTCAGFEEICFEVDEIALPNLPWITLGAELCFTLQTKTLVLTPAIDFGVVSCFDIYFAADTSGNLIIGDISIVGIGLTCDIGAVTFSGLSELDPVADLVDDPYWEVYTISTNDDACCGPFSFDLSVYFLEGGLKLFDVGLIDANMELQVAAQFTFNMGLAINVETGAFTEWVVGFLVEW